MLKNKKHVELSEFLASKVKDISDELEIKFDEVVYDKNTVSLRIREDRERIFYVTFFEDYFLVEYKKGKDGIFYSYSYPYVTEVPRISQLFAFYKA